MSEFTIDFFELGFLAEACIPPRPIARAMFWQSLTDKYWFQMTQNERDRLFEWLNRNDYYKESLKEHEDTQVFHARFNPENQYNITTVYKEKKETRQCFLYKDRYYTSTTTSVVEDYITKIDKL